MDRLRFLIAAVKHFHRLAHVHFLSLNHVFITSTEFLSFICSFAKTDITDHHFSQHSVNISPSLPIVFNSDFLSFCGAPIFDYSDVVEFSHLLWTFLYSFHSS